VGHVIRPSGQVSRCNTQCPGLLHDDYVQAETARRELALRRQRTLEMYRDGLCDKAFRDKSLADISEEEGRWDCAKSTPGMSPLQALERVRGFSAAVQESSPDAQREVVERVFTRIAIRDDQVVDVDIYPVYAEALRWYLRPQPDKFRTPSEFRNDHMARQRPIDGRWEDGKRTVRVRSPRAPVAPAPGCASSFPSGSAAEICKHFLSIAW
jgi:hypothetical protein